MRIQRKRNIRIVVVSFELQSKKLCVKEVKYVYRTFS